MSLKYNLKRKRKKFTKQGKTSYYCEELLSSVLSCYGELLHVRSWLVAHLCRDNYHAFMLNLIR